MNNKVLVAPAEGPVVKLAAYGAGERADIPSGEASGDSIVWISPFAPPLMSFKIGLGPETVEGLSDVQFVVGALPFEGIKVKGENDSGSTTPSYNQPSPTPKAPTVPSPSSSSKVGSSFVDASNGGGILCNGRRGHARGKKGTVSYDLVTKPKRGGNRDDEGNEILAEVVAGYAAYHGPVTLTPRIIFKRKNHKANSGAALDQGEL
ncbi:hypothetical protein ACHAWF_018374 [Thalassiosira exigua]